MLGLAYYPTVAVSRLEAIKIYRTTSRFVVCKIKGPRPRSPRVWKTNKRIGTISKSAKLVECIKGLSNVKEEVYGALDSFIAWELEFPLITVKKALKTLENQKDWKRIIQMTKWMLSKGQGRTMGSYFTLLNAFAEDGRLEEAEELWTKLFSENLESMPRIFFDKMVSIYYHRGMYENMFEIFADMEELSIRPSVSIVSMVGKAFQELGMLDKYKKLKKKYPPPKWEYRYIKGKRVKIERKDLNKLDDVVRGAGDVEKSDYSNESSEEVESNSVVHIVEPENVNQIANVEQAQLNESSEEVESNSVVHIVEPENVNQIENVEQAQLNESSEEVESNSVVHIVEPENVNQIKDIEQAQLNESSEEVESNSVVHIVKPENVTQIRGC